MKITLLIISLLMVGATGCKKCIDCYVTGGQFNCHKPGDTILVKANTGRTIRDTLIFYRDSGYTCDTIRFGYYYGAYNNRRCPNNLPERAYENLDSCTLD